MIEAKAVLEEPELRLRIRQLEAAEARTLLIVRALTYFYSAVAGFVASTLVSLVGAVLIAAGLGGVQLSFAVAFLAGSVGVIAMITGAIMLARETNFSFRVLREEKSFLAERVERRIARIVATPAKATQ